MITTLPGAAAADLASVDWFPGLASECGSRPISNQSMLGVRLGSLCLCVIRQTLPGCLQGRTTQSWFMSKPLTRMTKAISIDRRWRKFVWPDKCYCIGVKVASIVELLNVSPAGDCQGFAFKCLRSVPPDI